jgi:hypothetical protein
MGKYLGVFLLHKPISFFDMRQFEKGGGAEAENS